MGEFRDGALGDVLELKRGYDLPERDRIPGPVPIVSSSGITAYHARPMVKGPGVITGRYGTLGQVFYVTDDFWPLNTALYVRDFKGNDPRFVAYFLRSLDFYAYSDKGAVPGLNRNHLHLAPVRYPVEVQEQRAIASTLGVLDDKIELNRRMNETLEAVARAIFKDWFVDFGPTRAKMERGAPYLSSQTWSLLPDRLNDDGTPQGWRKKRVGDLFDISIGRTPPRNEKQHFVAGGLGLPWLSIKTMGGLQTFAFTSEEDLTPHAVALFRVPLIPAGTVIVSFKLTVGRVAIAANDMYSNEAIAHLVATPSTPVAEEFAYCFMKAFDYNSLGSTSSIATAVNSQSIKDIEMLVPDVGSHQAFVHLVEPLFHRIKANSVESQILARTRDLLLPKLTSGEVRIRDAQRAVEAVV